MTPKTAVITTVMIVMIDVNQNACRTSGWLRVSPTTPVPSRNVDQMIPPKGASNSTPMYSKDRVSNVPRISFFRFEPPVRAAVVALTWYHPVV